MLEDIPIVKREFANVFLDDLAGLSLDWEREFSIDLVQGINPISNVSDRIALMELKELKKQLEGLLEMVLFSSVFHIGKR